MQVGCHPCAVLEAQDEGVAVLLVVEQGGADQRGLAGHVVLQGDASALRVVALAAPVPAV